MFLHADTFAQDFFLTYPAFISITELCDLLRARYQGPNVKVLGVDETSLKAQDDSITKKRRYSGMIVLLSSIGILIVL